MCQRHPADHSGQPPLDLLRHDDQEQQTECMTSYFLFLVSSIHDVNALRGAIGQPDQVLSAISGRVGRASRPPSPTRTMCAPSTAWTMLPYVKKHGETLPASTPPTDGC